MAVAAIILAAGLSSRMGRNKLLEDVAGKPMVRRVAEAALASRARPVIAVVGNEAEAVRASLNGLDLRIEENNRFREGLSSSLRVGVEAIPQSSKAVLIVMGDMPRVSARLIDAVIDGFAPDGGRAICVATHGGRRGHPVLFARKFFSDLRSLSGDAGAKRIIESNESLVAEIEAGDDAPLADIDTLDALARVRAFAQ